MYLVAVVGLPARTNLTMAAEERGTPLLNLIELIGFLMRQPWDTSMLILLN